MTHPAAEAVSELRERIGRSELHWRRDHLPPPTRARPLPDPDAVRVARALEECGRKLDRIGGLLRNRPARAAASALEAHLAFLLDLTDRSDSVVDPDQLLSSLRHLEAMTEEI